MNSNRITDIINKFDKTNEIRPKKILIVNKNTEDSRLLKELLEKKYQIIVPETETDFLKQTFDLLILDNYFLEKYEKQLKKIKKREDPIFLPYLFLSSNDNKQLNNQNLNTIVDDLLIIPVSKAILKTRINNLLKIRKLSLKSEYRYFELAEKSPIGICILNSKKITYSNPTFLEIINGELQSTINKSFLNFIPREDKEKVENLFNRNNNENHEIRIVDYNNNIKWIDFAFKKIKYQNFNSFLITAQDITEKKKAKEKIKYLNFHDKLTGLYNRNFFEIELERLDVKRQLPLSVILGDINNLKLINDAFGHHKGDLLLKKIAEILKRSCRDEDIIARWGGDEFIILLNQTTKEESLKISDRIKTECEETKNLPIPISIALGVAEKKDIDKEFKKVLKKAEDRMYRNKVAGSESTRNSIIVSLENTLLEKSHETKEHAARISNLAVKFAKNLDLHSSDIDKLKLLSKLHDIGKVSIQENILKKPGKLTDEEYEVIKGHAESGYRIIKTIPELASVAEGILSHHERWDGKGYPQGLYKKEIPYIARILTIIDSYDVMTHKRSYKEAFTQEKAIEELKQGAGGQFDPELTKVFIEMILSD